MTYRKRKKKTKKLRKKHHPRFIWGPKRKGKKRKKYLRRRKPGGSYKYVDRDDPTSVLAVGVVAAVVAGRSSGGHCAPADFTPGFVGWGGDSGGAGASGGWSVSQDMASTPVFESPAPASTTSPDGT